MAMEKYCPGVRLVDPSQGEVKERNFDAFVDDVNAGIVVSAWKKFNDNSRIKVGSSLYEQTKTKCGILFE